MNFYNQRKNILRSNREAGLGRYDLVLEHNVSKNLFIFEFSLILLICDEEWMNEMVHAKTPPFYPPKNLL